jgi:hypothetical protein
MEEAMHQKIARVSVGLLSAGVMTCWVTSASAQTYLEQAPAPTYVGTTYAGQEQPYLGRVLPAPTNAFELKVGTQYTQGFGMIAPGQSIPNTAGAGIGVSADVDYRSTPYVSVGLQGEYQEFNAERDTSARGLTGNLGVTYHAMPYSHGDPFVRLGTGYRLLWQVNPPGAPTTLLHGFQLAKLQVGYDIRVSKEVAIAPQVGADLNLFVWSDQNGVNNQLSTAQVGTFIFAGLQGRFDAGSYTRGGTTIIANSQ